MAGQQNQNQNVDLFDTYFRRADLDRDGRISGAEAVGFFQGSNISKQILAQIWMHADQNRTGFLGRQEFYNFLKLVTVVQSKRDLTPEIVKAALYGPASAKIPAPQMNFAATPVPQVNSRLPTPQMNLSATPVPQVNSRPNAPSTQVNPMPPSSPFQIGAGTQMSPQTYGFTGQVPPNPGMNLQYFPPQGNQSTRPPIPMPSGNASRPSQGVAGPNFPQGGGIAGASPSNPSLSTDWLGGRAGGSPSAASSHVPHRGISPSNPSVGQKPPDALSMTVPVAVNNPNTLVGQGNGLSSNSMFGGDMFSVNQLAPKQVNSSPAYSASAPASSAIVPVSSGAPPPPKIDPLESLNAFTRQSAEGQLPASQPVLKPNQSYASQNNNSLGSSGSSVDIGNSTSQQEPSWPKMTRAGIQRYHKVFVEVDTDRDGRITGDQARNLFLSWRLPREVLKQVWDLADQDNDSMLTVREFCIALFLMERYREGQQLPATLPSSVILDETLLSLAGPPTTSYGTATWGSNPGLTPQQEMPGTQSMTPDGPRSPMPSGFSMPDGNVLFNQQKRGVPSMENSNMGHLGNGDHNLTDSRDQKETEKENKVEKEKMLLDSKEKMVFYREKMQDLILFKSRCDNRLNEITERAIADKRESELLGKKYEEKYKQVAEIASKLTIEEAAFRDIQERKMEYNQAIIKMQQGGSADGILQVRADRIQSDLEELLKALTERCKKHGVHVKSAALIELPRGWQPGIPENSAVWDEEWDKFDDEGFSFDVAVTTDAKSASHVESSSPIDGFSPGSLSNADDKSDLFNKFDHTVESESAHSHSEDESMKSPTISPARRTAFDSPARPTAFDSPARQTAFDIPSRDYSDEHSRKSIEADTETQRSFDEPKWGTFDNNDDTDSVWGFSSMNAKDPDHEKHGEKYFFESSEYGGSPLRTDSPQADIMYQKKSPFRFEDSVPSSPLSRAGNSPRYSDGLGDQFFNNMSRYDSFSAADGDSSRRESFARFDSMSSASGFDHSRGFSFDDSDPFGSSGPFKVSSERETPKKGTDSWNAF